MVSGEKLLTKTKTKTMRMGLFDLFDQAIADTLAVDVDVYIETIEKFNDEDMTFIIESMISKEATAEDRQKAKDLFDSKVS